VIKAIEAQSILDCVEMSALADRIFDRARTELLGDAVEGRT